MTTASERLAALRKKLAEARDDNLQAVEDEKKRQQIESVKGLEYDYNSCSDEDESETHIQKRKRTKRSSAIKHTQGGEPKFNKRNFQADEENEDERLRSIKRREKNVPVKESKAAEVVVYGGSNSTTKNEDCNEMVEELQRTEQRRFKYHRRRKFREDGHDINFINEGNRLFNRTLDRHFNKHDSVQKLKNNLERGTG